MRADDSFHAMIAELLAPLGFIRIRRMFGGAGVYCDGIMIGLTADDALYFKADALTRTRYEREGLGPFVYAKSGGRSVTMSYWRVPERLFEEPEEMLDWARAALRAARASARPSKGRARGAGR